MTPHAPLPTLHIIAEPLGTFLPGKSRISRLALGVGSNGSQIITILNITRYGSPGSITVYGSRVAWAVAREANLIRRVTGSALDGLRNTRIVAGRVGILPAAV